MPGWLKKYKRRRKHELTGSKHAAALKNGVGKAQQKIAGKLSDWDSLLTIKERKIVVLLFFSGMFTLSGWMLCSGIWQKPAAMPGYLRRQTITRPKSTDLPDSLNIHLLEEKRLQQLKQQQQKDTISQHK